MIESGRVTQEQKNTITVAINKMQQIASQNSKRELIADTNLALRGGLCIYQTFGTQVQLVTRNLSLRLMMRR